MERPKCWSFAMDFLGGPEDEIVEAYVTGLERRLDEALKDSRRYNWLKAMEMLPEVEMEDWDADIDAAIAKASETQGPPESV